MSDIATELSTINEAAKLLAPLSKGGQRRALAWLADFFDVYEEECVCMIEDDELEEWEDEPEAPAAEPEAEPAELTIDGLLDAVAPKTAIQKIVTAAWWIENKEGATSWKSFEVNKLLKSLGIKLSSISGTLALEGKKDDPMVVVLDKSSDSMQARKTFRLSDAGVAFVEGRLG